MAELLYAKQSLAPVRWVLAVPEDAPVQSRARPRRQGDRHGSGRISPRNIWRKHGVTARVEFSWGATEVKVPQLADAIVEVTETGSSLRANRLRIVDTVLESRRVYRQYRGMRRSVDAGENLASGVAAAGRHRRVQQSGHHAECAPGELDAVLNALPALKNPTISDAVRPGLGGHQHHRG